MSRRPLTVPTSGTQANAEDYGDTPTPLAVWVTPDGVVVGGPGAWQQLSTLLPEAYAAAWSVVDWYLDSVIGNDTNNGTSAATPLRTGAELYRRLGGYAVWNHSLTVHILANGLSDNLILAGMLTVPGTHLDVVGTPIVVLTDTIATYTVLNHATPEASLLTAVGIADWTPYQWLRVRQTSGASADSLCWVAKAAPNGAGLNVARTSRWVQVAPAITNSIIQTATPTLGASIEVASLPHVPSLTLRLDGPLSQANTANYPERQWSVRDIEVPFLDLNCSSMMSPARAFVFGCQLSQVKFGTPGWQTAIWCTQGGCFFDAVGNAAAAGTMWQAGLHFGTLYGRNTVRVDVYDGVFGGGSYQLFQGTRIRVSLKDWAADNLQIFDVPNVANAAVDLLNTARFSCTTGMSGNGNAGIAFRVQNLALVKLQGVVNLQAAVATVRLASAPIVDLSWTQFLLPDDWQQKGITPAMVAGSTTVTVPYYDNVNQQVTVSHAAFAGTPGILSVQQISTTQFTVTSSNVLDTSTVRWHISPLGRNIFISTT